MRRRLGKRSVRLWVLGVSVAVLGGLLAPVPLEAAAPKPKEVPPPGVTGKAPKPELERPKGIFEN